ncbi:hypothetical protein D3C85_1863420 [compost metagenome]
MFTVTFASRVVMAVMLRVVRARILASKAISLGGTCSWGVCSMNAPIGLSVRGRIESDSVGLVPKKHCDLRRSAGT